MSDSDRSVFEWSASEKLRLVEDLWDDIASNSAEVEMPAWQKEELERRMKEWKKNPPVCSSWDAVKGRILSRDR